ncbi:MAG: coenzyme F420-0:L-glutamate ligase [Porticoccaceae bacterium]
MSNSGIQLIALPDFPLIQPGDDLFDLILKGLSRAGETLAAGDILVVAQKIVSKAENRYVELSNITPSPKAQDLAKQVEKDSRLVEVILSESNEVVRTCPGVLVVEHKLGYVMANAGVDASNIKHAGSAESRTGDRVLLLPTNPDGSAAELAKSLSQHGGCPVGVIINDSVGRAWRNGTVGLALGAAGFPALYDRRGEQDLFGRTLEVSEVALADQVAAAAALVQGEGDEGLPVVLVRGVSWPETALPNNAETLLRPKHKDLFR